MPGARGVFNVTGPPAVPLSAILAYLEKPVVDLPHFLFEPLVERMYGAGAWSSPPRRSSTT